MDIAQLGLEIRSDGVVVAKDRLKDFDEQAQRTEKSTDGLSRAFRVIGPLVGAVAAAFSVRALVQYADAWSDLSSRVGAAIKDMDAAPQMMRRMVDMANASYSPLEQTVEVYSRNVNTLKELGYAADGAADFTEALNHALVITATRGERAESVQNALSKAMAVGKLQADGLETVLANGGRVAEALAAELGTTTSGLRSMASEGKITGEVIASALTGRLSELRDEAAEMPATIGDAFVRINNNTTAFVGTLDKAWGVSSRISEIMLGMADTILASTDTFLRLGNIVRAVVGPAFDLLASNIDLVGQVGTVAGAALLGFFAGPALIAGIAGATTAIVTGLVPALAAAAAGVRSIGIAMAANPLGLLIAGFATVVTAAFMFRDQIRQAFGIDLVQVFKAAANAAIGAFVGAYEAIKRTWGMLPSAIGDLVATAVNGLIGAVEAMLNSIIGKLNNFMNEIRLKAYDMGHPLPEGVGTPIAPVTFDRVQNPNAGAVGAVADVAGKAFSDAQKDYVGGLGDALGETWKNATGAGDAITALGEGLETTTPGMADFGGAAGAANDNMKSLEASLKTIQDLYASENELLLAQFEERIGIIEEARAAELIGQEEFNELRLNLERDYAQQMFEIQANQFAGALDAAGGFFGALATTMGQENDGMIKVQKTFAAASALINAWLAASQALADPTVPFWGKFAAVASVVTAGMGIVNAIKSGSTSTNGGSGGRMSASNGANNATAQAAAAAPESRQINVTLGGSGRYSREEVQDLIEQLADGISDGVDGGKFKVAVNS